MTTFNNYAQLTATYDIEYILFGSLFVHVLHDLDFPHVQMQP